MIEEEWKRPRKVWAPEDRKKVWRAGKAPRSHNPAQHEVIVRVTGRTKGGVSLLNQLKYLTRKGEVPAQLSNGKTVQSEEDSKALRTRWMAANRVFGREEGSQSIGLVLSMPAGTRPDAVSKAARDWAKQYISPVSEWLMVTHTDRPHPHVHFAIRSVQNNGRRIEAGHHQIQAWREGFAQELQFQGVEAIATPRIEKLQRIMRDRPVQDRPDVQPDLPASRLRPGRAWP